MISLKNVLLGLVFIFLALPVLKSEPVDQVKAKKTAYNFLKSRTEMSTRGNITLSLYQTEKSDNDLQNLYYIFNLSPEGFIIVSADDNLVPVLAYSFEGLYEYGRNPVQEAFLREQTSLAYANMIDDPANKSRWNALQNSTSTKSGIKISPLCTTKWNQDIHYNYMCPVDSSGPGNHVYAGCVATAMGQVMRYWSYPENGYSGYAYQHIWPMYFHNYGVVEANFEATTYNWGNMPNQISAGNRIDVATLLFHCGVAIKMNYGPDGSGAHTEDVPFALSYYFKYNNDISFIERAFITPLRWDSIIKDQLDKGFPMVYSGSTTSEGHAWVVDGYQDSSYFHVNWGWGGWNNGYYYFSNLNSGNGDFTNYQGAVINIFPKNYTVTNSIETENPAFIYPNPSSDYFVIKNISPDAVVNIYNMNGQLQLRAEGNEIVNTAHLSTGIYIVQISDKKRNQTLKLSVIR